MVVNHTVDEAAVIRKAINYIEGADGVLKDPQRGIGLLKTLANGGNAIAASILVEYYEKGIKGDLSLENYEAYKRIASGKKDYILI